MTTASARAILNKQNRGKKTSGTRHIFNIMRGQEEDPNSVISGILRISNAFAHVLFDTRATHLVVSSELAEKLTITLIEMDFELCALPQEEL